MEQTVAHISWGAIVGGVLLILLGAYLAMYQVLPNAVGDVVSQAVVAYSSPAFLNWLRLLGILIAVRGAYLVGTSFVPSGTLAGQVVGLGNEMLSALAIPLLLWLRKHVDLIPIVSIWNRQVHVTAPAENLARILRWALTAVIVLMIVGIVAALFKLLTGQGMDRT